MLNIITESFGQFLKRFFVSLYARCIMHTHSRG